MSGKIAEFIYDTFSAGMYFSAPILLLAMVIGLFTGIIQAAIQLQEQSIPQILKIFAVSSIVIFMGASLAQPIVSVSERIFSSIALNGR